MRHIYYNTCYVQIITQEAIALVRKQFTFYYSYFDAIKNLKAQDRLAIYDAVVTFALEGTEPKLRGDLQQTAFKLIRPTVASARKRAEAALKNGTDAQTTGFNKKEIEIEIEKEIKKENEIETETEIEGEAEGDAQAGGTQSGFEDFWESYPCHVSREKARRTYDKLAPDHQTQLALLRSVEQWKNSPIWKLEDGRYIPHAHRFLSEGHWLQPPPQEQKGFCGSGEMGKAELEAIQRVLRDG